MALTREQYDEIMRTLSDRRSAALARQKERQEAVEKQLPALRDYNDKIADLSRQEVEARLHRDSGRVEMLQAERRRLVLEKDKLLQEAGISPDYAQAAYFCTKCKDTGYHDNEKCGCMRQLESELLNREAGLPELLARENFSTFDLGVFDDRQPLSELMPGRRITQQEYMRSDILPVIRQFLIGFEEPGSHNILMIGPPGTGKTFLCNCIARRLIERQHTVMYERADRLFGAMTKEHFAREKDETQQQRFERIGSCELLVLDDLGTEFMTDYTKTELFSLISNRLSGGLSTIISSNLSMNQIKNIYSERISSRLMGEYRLLRFFGADLRLTRRQ